MQAQPTCAAVVQACHLFSQAVCSLQQHAYVAHHVRLRQQAALQRS
jgi:hypothetical protein